MLPASQVRDNEARNTFGAIALAGGVLTALPNFTSSQVGTRANRWVGTNRGGWSNAEYDRIWDELNSTLARSERERQIAQLARVLSEEVPAFPLYAQAEVWAYSRSVRGLQPGANDTDPLWNIYLWEVAG